MKKYIEYGWLYGANNPDKIDFKLNFRDGLETLAGLHQYSKVYEQSSEIVHSTPMLIYSNKIYYYLTTLLNTYESFFRIEKVFASLFLSQNSKAIQERYKTMRNIYYSQLISIYRNEKNRLISIAKPKQNN